MRRTRLLPPASAAGLMVLLFPAIALGLGGLVGPAASTSAPALPPVVSELDASGTARQANASTGAAAAATTESGPDAQSSVSVAGAHGGGAAGPSAPSATATAAALAGVEATRPQHEIRLDCALVRTGPSTIDPVAVAFQVESAAAIEGGPAIQCRWATVATTIAAVADPVVRAYQLWRLIDAPGGRPRELLATIPAGDPLRYLDDDVSRGHVYTYAVIGLGADGSTVAVSQAVSVAVPPAAWEVIRLACEPLSSFDAPSALADAAIQERRAVACRWSAAQDPDTAGYVLWRSVDGGPREAIYRTDEDGPRTFVDARVRPGPTIRYAVAVVDAAGRTLGIGGPVVVQIPPSQALRLSCEFVSALDRRGVGCQWSAATNAAAAVYVVWRSVDGGPREAIHKVGPDGPFRHLDSDVRAGQAIHYAVVAYDRAGRVVGLGGPVLVRIPAPASLSIERAPAASAP